MKLAFDSSVSEARKNETEREYVKSDCADMHLSSENTKIYSLKPWWDSNLRHLFILLVLLVYQRMQFSRLEILHDADRIRICLLIVDSCLADNSEAF